MKNSPRRTEFQEESDLSTLSESDLDRNNAQRSSNSGRAPRRSARLSLKKEEDEVELHLKPNSSTLAGPSKLIQKRKASLSEPVPGPSASKRVKTTAKETSNKAYNLRQRMPRNHKGSNKQASGSLTKQEDDLFQGMTPSGVKAKKKRSRAAQVSAASASSSNAAPQSTKSRLMLQVDDPIMDGGLLDEEEGLLIDDLSDEEQDPIAIDEGDDEDMEHSDASENEEDLHAEIRQAADMILEDPLGQHENLRDEDDEPEDGPSSSRSFSNVLAGLSGFSGLLQGFSNRLKGILNALRDHSNPDPTQKLVALQELTEILSISTEDTLSGYFQIDSFTKELVNVLKGGDIALVGEESAVEMMLLACRCLANLMEALPGSGHNVVAAGAVSILCAKLLEIQYIDLAEQTLSTLEKISEEVPSSIVSEGGLAALLSYLDFFSTNVQRTAVTAAANCCRSLALSSFNMVKDVIPILRNVLTYSDQRVVEQACLAVTRIIESYRHHAEKLEALLTPELLGSLVALLVPTSSPIANNTYTSLIRTLALAARTSPQVAMSLLEMHVGSAIYQILTGVAAPTSEREIETIQRHSEADDMIVLQNLVHRPKEQVQETLSLIVELLPALPKDGIFHPKPNVSRRKLKARVKREEHSPALANTPTITTQSEAENEASTMDVDEDQTEQKPIRTGKDDSSRSPTRSFVKSSNEQRMDLFSDDSNEGRRQALKRFYALILPTLLDVYSASIGLAVKTKSMLGITKIVFLCPKELLVTILNALPLANFLGSILASKDHNSLIISGLQLAELFLVKIPDASQYLFRREGVLHEITQLASLDLLTFSNSSNVTAIVERERDATLASEEVQSGSDITSTLGALPRASGNLPPSFAGALLASGSRALSSSTSSAEAQMNDLVTQRARFMRDRYCTAGVSSMQQANKDLKIIRDLATRLTRLASLPINDPKAADLQSCLNTIASLFTNVDKPISSFEMLESGLVDSLLNFIASYKESSQDALSKQNSLVKALASTNGRSNTTALSSLVKRLQESLSRSEEFEVVTALQESGDQQNSASMLARQLKLRLSTDDTDIPRSVANIVVSIHAIATFQAFNDYLRPRISAMLGNSSASSTVQALNAAITGRLQSSTSAPDISEQVSDLLGATSVSGTSPMADAATEDHAKADSAITETAAPQIMRRRSSRLAKTASTNRSASGGSPKRSSDNDVQIGQELSGADQDGQDEPTTSLDAVEGSSLLEGHTPGGTRVATPVHRGSATFPPSSTTSTPARARASYAAALKAPPTDWHIEFYMDDQEIPIETTIYGAVHQYELRQNSQTSRTMWQNVYPVKFRKVSGPGPTSATRVSPEAQAASEENPLTLLPDFIAPESAHAKILGLLRSLYYLNSDIPELVSNDATVTNLSESAFINNKLTAKLNRQLEEPMIVASSCLPEWALDFPQSFPFLFPFESRFAFLQSTAFGYARLMQKWVGQARQDSRRDENLAFLGRLQRQKVRLARERLLESAFKVFELYGQSRAVLEIEFFSEVGTGLGPTLEFYALVSKEFSRRDLKLWRTHDSSNPSLFVDNPQGLFPLPIPDDEAESEGGRKVTTVFKVLGQFVAKALMDSRIIDIPFNRIFMKLLLDKEPPLTTATVKAIDTALGTSLDHLQAYVNAKQVILSDISNSDSDKAKRINSIKIKETTVDDLSLDFTLPGHPDILLIPNGQDIDVTIENVEEYVKLVIEYTIRQGVARQVKAFREGFSEVFPIKDLACFSADELVLVFGNSAEDWNVETLHESIRADHGFSTDSRVVNQLLDLMSQYDKAHRRLFLSFATGSPRLPVGGFKALHPPLTVVRKPPESGHHADEYLPSVMTCQNYIKMPEYSSEQVLRDRLEIAIKEGQGAFHLS